MSRSSAALRWVLWLLAAGAGVVALALGVLWVQAARLPYNPQGRHFADGVVHHAQAVPVYGGLAALCLAAAVALAWLGLRLGRRK